MQAKKKYCLFCLLLLFYGYSITAQHLLLSTDTPNTILQTRDAAFIIGDIAITGNKKTKPLIILRELPFKKGDKFTLSVLLKKFETARIQLMNTALFHTVIVAAKDFNKDTASIIIDVKERWYIFPIPYFKPVDRNLNQWIVEQNASLKRLDFGAKILYNNITGLNDKFRLWLIGGYTKQLSVNYDRLYIDKGLKWGINMSFAYGQNKEINYNSINDKQVFLKDSSKFIRNFINTSFDITYRRAIKTRHSLGVSYISEKVKDTVLQLNPNYFSGGRKSISFPSLYYKMAYYDLDYIPYPTKGYAAFLYVTKKGINSSMNVWLLNVKGSGTWPVLRKTFFNLNVFGGLVVPFKQPYYNQRFLGYGDVFMQGYEYYVIDGVAGGYIKSTLTRELFNFRIRIPQVKKGKETEHIPFRIFGKIYGNTGYVHNPQPGENSLSNKMLYAGGFGIDILTFYDVTFKFEWTFNQLGENGIFIHRKTIF